MKKKHILIYTLTFIFLFSCGSYNRIQFSSAEFFSQEKAKENISQYDLFIHQGAENYILKSPQIVGDSIKGEFESIKASDLPVSDAGKKRVENSLKNDIHIYLKEDSKLEKINLAAPTGVSRNEIKNVEMYAKEKVGLTGLYITLIIVGLSLLTILTVAIVAKTTATASEQSSDGSSNGSNNSSDGSSDGSQGSSDGSNGSSDGSSSSSDGSGSSSDGSGCYIATMAYGSYDAPRVVILREFRDKFLEKTIAGRMFIKWYYKNSPGFVERHKSKLWLHSTLRFALNILTSVLKPFFSK